ncbi:RWD domain-containing protein 1 [Stegostoma tigrinum]|uniref:RWD domain-containing protein 1 n=1 Tax=Stegostoma tigrinum TaxID=3053191 RepID=UPI00202B0864|nr:RWD domain-containing protein 1 [Stegostoma tigrinum]
MCRAGLSVGVALYLNGVSQSFNMTDYIEEQRNELEALESIYPDSFTVVSENPTSFTITVTSDTGQNEETVEATIQFTYVEHYPDDPPLFEVIGQENVQKSDVADIITLLNEQTQENIGMVMIFTLVTAVQEKLNEIVDQIKFRKEEEKLLKEKEAEEVEKAVFHGTPVTIENFLTWKAKFDAELAEIRRKQQREEEQAGKAKLTGKQLFETDHNLDTSDIQFLEEGNNVEVDESLFQDMDDLELDDDDDDDPDYNPDLGSEED